MLAHSYVTEEVQYKSAEVFAVFLLIKASSKVIMYSSTCFYTMLETTLMLHFFCHMRGLIYSLKQSEPVARGCANQAA
jgi:hypothetical protein